MIIFFFSLHPIKTHRWFLELHFMYSAALPSPPSCRLLELSILSSLFSYCSFPFNQFYCDKFLKSEPDVTITKKFQSSFNLSYQQSFSWSQYSILFCYTFLIWYVNSVSCDFLVSYEVTVLPKNVLLCSWTQSFCHISMPILFTCGIW